MELRLCLRTAFYISLKPERAPLKANCSFKFQYKSIASLHPPVESALLSSFKLQLIKPVCISNHAEPYNIPAHRRLLVR